MKKGSGLIFIIAAAVVLELISAFQYYYMHELLEQELQGRAQTELTLKAVITKRSIENTERSLKSHIREIKSNLDAPDSLSKILAWIIKFHPSRRGAGVAFKPYYFPKKGRLFEPYALRTDSGDIVAEQIAGENFDYTRDGFYRDIINNKAQDWVGPYDDKYLNQRLITYAVPIYEKKTGDTVAVFGIDIDTRYLADALNKHHLYPSSYDVLLTEEGELIAGSANPAMEKNVEHVVNIINDSSVTKRQSSNGRTTIAEFHDPDNGEKCYVFYANFRGQPHWQIATVYYDNEVYGDLRRLRVYMLQLMLAVFAVLGFIVWRFFRNSMRLQKSLLRQERIGSELKIARNIQAKMLPNIFPPFPERNDIDLYGLLIPAREVGGDLFDFFIRDEKLFFCIGDVSGKGVPAAMVMAVTRSLFRSASTHENNPSRIMHTLNETLCQGNDSNMFVTFFIGVLNLPTGRLRYCDAGHDKPIVITGSNVHKLEAQPHLPLGVFNNFRFNTEEFILPADSTLFLYTDGLTEAKNTSHKQFTLRRVTEKLETMSTASSKQLIADMEQSVQHFVDGAEQSDDLTMLAIHYTPQVQENVIEEEITITNDVHQVVTLNQFVKSVLQRIGISDKEAKQLQLAVEEAAVNIIDYAYPAGVEGTLNLKIAYDGQLLRFVITDQGIPFDPTKQLKADTTLSAEDRPIGGLGILLIRKMMDTINYERAEHKNVLTLIKKIRTKIETI